MIRLRTPLPDMARHSRESKRDQQLSSTDTSSTFSSCCQLRIRSSFSGSVRIVQGVPTVWQSVFWTTKGIPFTLYIPFVALLPADHGCIWQDCFHTHATHLDPHQRVTGKCKVFSFSRSFLQSIGMLTILLSTRSTTQNINNNNNNNNITKDTQGSQNEDNVQQRLNCSHRRFHADDDGVGLGIDGDRDSRPLVP